MIFHSKNKYRRNEGSCQQYQPPTATPSSLNKEDIKLDPEQTRVIDWLTLKGADFSEVRLVARAGSGKTTVLAALCEKMENRNISYIVFNKNAKDHFLTRIDTKRVNVQNNNLVVNTMHGFCLKWFQSWKKNTHTVGEERLNVECGITADQVISALQIDVIVQRRINKPNPGNSSEASWIAQCLLKSLENFTNSATKTVTTQHLCDKVKPSELNQNPRQYANTSQSTINFAEYYIGLPWVELVQNLYIKSINVDDPSIPITHSTYQKCCQVNEGQITQYNAVPTSKKRKKGAHNKDMLVIDEAQDLNPCQMAIIRNQHLLFDASVVYVGDPCQSIYQFRGATRQFETMVCNIIVNHKNVIIVAS